ncbi:L-glutamine kinase [subsurface metagenome]
MTMLKHLRELTERRRAERISYLQIALPPVLRDPSDLVVVSYYAARPNFVTQEVVQAPVIYIREIGPVVADEISGKIVLFDRADPGFDWIFEYTPAGLITQFGGVGSHMTIRCGEFGLPAAIGCGEALFSVLTRTSVVILDCEGKMIVPVKLGGS